MKAQITNLSSMKRQRGVATLLVSIVTLLLVTLLTLSTSKTVLMEQKITANEMRSKQAFEASETGINEAMGYIQNDPDWEYLEGLTIASDDTTAFNILKSDPALTDPDINTETLANNSLYTLRFGADTDFNSSPPRIEIISAGASDDGIATRTITTLIKFDDPNYFPTENPVLNRGAAVISGNANVYNTEGHSTIWSGGNVTLGGATTYIADPSDPTYPGCMDVAMTCNVVASSTGANVGLDVVEYDSSLDDLTNDEFFQNFFGSTKAIYKANTVKLVIDGANASNNWDPESPSTSGVHLSTSTSIWVDGDADISANKRVGCASTDNEQTPYAYDGSVQACPGGTGGDIKPTVLIIDGDATFRGGAEFYGIVYVTGALTINGTVRIEGSIVVEGNSETAAGGTLDVWYNTDVLTQTDKTGNIGGADGGWRDF